MHPMIVIALTLLLSSSLLGQDNAPDLPAALDQADARFVEAVRSAQAIRMRVYERELQTATRAGKLDRATAIRERMQQFDVPTPDTRTLKILVPATRNALNPIVVTTVKRGDRIGIRPLDGQWTGGGTQRGRYTDWSGYNTDNPWMVLHARIGDRPYPIRQPRTFKANVDGDLVLYCEDRDSRDNEGQIAVSVSVTPEE